MPSDPTRSPRPGYGLPSAGWCCLRTPGRCAGRPRGSGVGRSVGKLPLLQMALPARPSPAPGGSSSLTCTRRWLTGRLSSTTWPTRHHTLTPPLPQVNACRMKLLTAMDSTGSPCFSVCFFSILYGVANFLECQGKKSGLQASLKSSGSQHLRRGHFGVTSLPVSPSVQRGHPSSPRGALFFFRCGGFPITLYFLYSPIHTPPSIFPLP